MHWTKLHLKNGRIKKIDQFIRENRRLNFEGITELTGIEKESFLQILHETFYMTNNGSLANAPALSIQPFISAIQFSHWANETVHVLEHPPNSHNVAL